MAVPWKKKPGNCFAMRWNKIGHRRAWDLVFLVASLTWVAWTCQRSGVPFRGSLPHSRRVTLNDPARYERRVRADAPRPRTQGVGVAGCRRIVAGESMDVKRHSGSSMPQRDAPAVALTPDPVIEAYKKDIDRTLLRETLKLTPGQRLAKLQEFMKAVSNLRGAARRPV